MLGIFNDLKPFFEDNYRRINVREYARLRKISPPSASTRLKNLEKEGLVKKHEEKNYLYFYANKENSLFINLQRIFYSLRLKEIGLLDYIEKELINPLIILFGSFANAEVGEKSDMDLAIFGMSNKKLDLKKFEKVLGKEIQLFMFKDRKDVEKDLMNNILNGHKIMGRW